MKKLLPGLSILVLTALAGCDGSSGSLVNMLDDSPDNGDTDPQAGPVSTLSANYRLTFEATWSAETHPLLFPENPHFSGLVGSVHNEQVIFWQPGDTATDGIKSMAETGARATLLEEVEFAIDSGYAVSAIDGDGISLSPGSVSIEFEVTSDFPLVTVTSMLAPSPDWFTGVHSLSLYDGQEFVQLQTLDMVLYDAGTDSGERYTSPNQLTLPRDPIGLVNSFPTDSPFFAGVPAVGRFIIERL